MMLRRTAALTLILSLALPWTPARADDAVVVFAAASLKTALDEAAARFHADGGPEVKISYGGSLGLARQIVAGAPADVFVSADESSMDEAANSGAIKTETRFDWLGNELVLVAPKSAPFDTLALTPDAISGALGGGKLATGEVNTVPVGKYARTALDKLGLWAVVEPHLAMSDNVRSALGFVARQEAPLGIVYATDAAAEPGVKIVAHFPESSHAPILYPAAVTSATHNPAAAQFEDFLKSNAAKPIFERQGFRVVN